MKVEHQVEEMQGLYGPFSVSERLIQKIWLRRDFMQSGLRTLSGRSLEVQDPGRWNLQEGPDFLEARLVLDGVPLVGDVEIHFSVHDWWAHQHTENPNFNRVVLHVLLFDPPSGAASVRTQAGRTPETFVLLSALERDLESYAMDQALLELESQDELEWVVEFLALPEAEREARLQAGSRQRWDQKCAYAAKRLESSNWDDACHQYMLEVLGYARNRAPMARLALEYPLQAFRGDGLDPDQLFESMAGHWKLSGLRPANHPRIRLRQYASIVQARGQWPAHLMYWSKALDRISETMETGAFRKLVELPHLLTALSELAFANQVSASRLNTLCCDAFLPLLTAAGEIDGYPYWSHWLAGDMPVSLRGFLKYTGLVSREHPYSNGRLQGALALSLTQGRG